MFLWSQTVTYHRLTILLTTTEENAPLPHWDIFTKWDGGGWLQTFDRRAKMLGTYQRTLGSVLSAM